MFCARVHGDADLAAGRYEPLAVDWPTLVVQTTSGYEPHLEQITALVVSSALSRRPTAAEASHRLVGRGMMIKGARFGRWAREIALPA